VKTIKKIRHDETTVCYQVVLSELSPFDKLHLTSFQQNKEAFLSDEDSCRKGIQSDEQNF
jgi:hypothetical protein